MLSTYRVILFFAASPTKRSFGVNDTTEGVVRFPSSFGIISTFPFHTPTQQYVVPKSIPIGGADVYFVFIY